MYYPESNYLGQKIHEIVESMLDGYLLNQEAIMNNFNDMPNSQNSFTFKSTLVAEKL